MISFSASFNEIPTGILITDISSLSGTTFPGRCSSKIVFFYRAQLPVRRHFQVLSHFPASDKRTTPPLPQGQSLLFPFYIFLYI